MFNFPDPKTKDPRAHRWQRIMEIIPGTLTWFTLVGMFLFSFFLPVYVAIFIVAFDIYWIYRTIFIAYYSVEGYNRLKEGKQIDWWERCQNIENPQKYAAMIRERMKQLKESLAGCDLCSRKERRIVKKEIKRNNE